MCRIKNTWNGTPEEIEGTGNIVVSVQTKWLGAEEQIPTQIDISTAYWPEIYGWSLLDIHIYKLLC